jgi:hypothetical protein
MRSSIIRAFHLVALTLATTSATAPSAISGRRPPPNANPGNPFFEVWSWDVSGDYIARSSPLTTIPYNKLDPNGYRQHWNAIGQLGSSDSIISFSNTYHGKRYILGDEANIDTAHYGDTEADARLFADHYCDAVAAIHNVDGTATFVPGGFADGVAGSWLDAFVDEYHSYSSGKCDSIPIAEWDFHIWGTYSSLTDFYNRVATYESWAWNNGAPMSLGLWQLDFTDNPDSTTYMTRFRMAKNWLASRPHISVTRYSGYYPYSDFNTHSASDSYGNLSAIGLALGGYDTYATIVFGGQQGDFCLWVYESNIPWASVDWYINDSYVGSGVGWTTPFGYAVVLKARVSNSADDATAEIVSSGC